MAGCGYSHDGTDSAPTPGQTAERLSPGQKHPFLLQLEYQIDVVRTISTSATVLMISRCPGDQTEMTATRYRSVQPVNRYVSCSVIRCHQCLSSCISLRPGFSLLQVTNHIPLHLLQTLLQQISRATSLTASCSRCDSRSTLSAARLPVQLCQPGHAPARQFPDSLLCFTIRQVRFVLCHFSTISSARRSVSRRMASSACRWPAPLP